MIVISWACVHTSTEDILHTYIYFFIQQMLLSKAAHHIWGIKQFKLQHKQNRLKLKLKVKINLKKSENLQLWSLFPFIV